MARRADGTLVGSTITLIDAVRHVCDIGVSVEAAFTAASRTPANLFPGKDVGLLRPGDHADVLVLDDALNVRTVLQRGVPLDS